jgi:serine phosphatase RsbU (regulator of sigma subunit)
MEKNQEKDKKKKKIRFPLLVRISILVLLALILSGITVAVVSRNYRRKRAMEQGGETAGQACTIVRNYLAYNDFDKEFFQNLQLDHPSLDYLRDSYFPGICTAMQLRYLYLYTVDEKEIRHYVVAVALDAVEQEDLDEKNVLHGSFPDSPLQDNERTVLNRSEEIALQELDNESGHAVNCIMGYYDMDGELIALIGADCEMDYVMEIMRKDNNFFLIIGQIAIVITFFLVLILIHIWVLRPIRGLSHHMRNFKEEKELKIPESKAHFRDEVSDMESSFREMAEDLSNYVEDIQRMAAEKAEADVQLELARRIQNGMVPPEKGYFDRGCSVYAVMHPAMEVGGDFYDVFDLPMGNVGIVIGDISGKGIGAALFMSGVRRAVRERLKTGMLPAKVLKLVNDEIVSENPENFFATVFAASWDPISGMLTYANAGHNPPIRFGSKTEEIDIYPGDILGLFDDADFRNESVHLEIGEGILLYTDGVTEALNPEHAAYGKDRLLEQVSKLKPDSKTVVKDMLNDVLKFEGEGHIFDDITMIAIQRLDSTR